MSASGKKTPSGIIWFEIPVDDLNRAKKFYSALLGWKINPFPGMTAPEAQHYLHIDTGGEEASPIGGMMKRMRPEQSITHYVGVPSVTESMARVENLGGTICRSRTAAPQRGCFAICQDTEGNPFALWEWNTPAK